MKASQILPVAMAAGAVAQNSSLPLAQVIEGQDSLSVLFELLGNNTAILESLQEASNITILAPSNDALTELLESDVVTSSDDLSGLVAAVLSYHVLNGTYFAANVSDTPAFIPTLLTNSSYTNVTDGQVVEAVSSEEDGETVVTFYSALKAQSNVTEADIEFDGGVIHIINSTLTIPYNLTGTAIEGGLSAVVGALNLTEQASALEELEDVTIFAPNNEAFAAIANLVGNLSSDDLSSILSYHVIEGSVLYSSDLSNTSVETLGGEDVEVTVSEEGDVYVNAARVVYPDILIANGVVHVIDNVLNPNGTDEQNEPNPSTTQAAFSGASTATDGGVPLTSGLPEPTQTDTNLNDEDEDNADEEDAAPRVTGAVAMAAIFGGAALLMNGV